MSLKQLYFLHIPKTAGSFVSKNIKTSINNSLLCYVSNKYPNNKEFLKSKIYISAHGGRYPIEYLDNPDVATLIRDPLSARASYFNFIYPMYLYKRSEYQNLNSNREKFLYSRINFSHFQIRNNHFRYMQESMPFNCYIQNIILKLFINKTFR